MGINVGDYLSLKKIIHERTHKHFYPKDEVTNVLSDEMLSDVETINIDIRHTFTAARRRDSRRLTAANQKQVPRAAL
jgi:hypothetical protein